MKLLILILIIAFFGTSCVSSKTIHTNYEHGTIEEYMNVTQKQKKKELFWGYVVGFGFIITTLVVQSAVINAK